MKDGWTDLRNELSVFVDDEVGLKAVKLESQEKEEVEDPIQFDC